MKKILSATLCALVLLSLLVTPAVAAGSNTIYFYAGTSDNPTTYTDADGISYSYDNGAWILAMNPDSGWADVNGNNWAPQKMTDMGDGWYSYDLSVDPTAAPGIFVQFRNDGDDVVAENRIFICYISHAGQMEVKSTAFEPGNLWVVPVIRSENWNDSDQVREVFGTSFATKEEAEAAMNPAAETPDTNPVDDTVTGGKETANPQTGDNGFLFFALAALLVSAAAIVLMGRKQKA